MNDIDVIEVRYTSLPKSPDREKSTSTASNAETAPSKEETLCSSTFKISLGLTVESPELAAVSRDGATSSSM